MTKFNIAMFNIIFSCKILMSECDKYNLNLTFLRTANCLLNENFSWSKIVLIMS